MKPLLFIITLWLFFIAAVLCVTSFVQADELVRESRYQVMDDTGQIISQHDEIHVAIREAQAWSKSHDGRVAKIAPPSYRVQVDPITGPTPTPPDTGSGEAGEIPDWWTYETPCPDWIRTAAPRTVVDWADIKGDFVAGATIKDKTITNGGVTFRGKDIPGNITLENVEIVDQDRSSFTLDPTDGSGRGWKLHNVIIRFRAFDPDERRRSNGDQRLYGHGIYVGDTDIAIDECAILDAGWWIVWVDGKQKLVPYNQNHAAYLSTPLKVSITRSLILNAAGQGVKMKGCPDLLVEGNIIRGGLRGLGGDDRFNTGDLVIRNNIIEDQGGVDSKGAASAIGINLTYTSDKPGRITGKVIIEGNTLRGPAKDVAYNSPRYPLTVLGVASGAHITIRNNVIDWPGYPASIKVPADQLTLENNTGL